MELLAGLFCELFEQLALAVAERARIAKLPAADRLEPSRSLLAKEGKVSVAYGKYQDAVRAAIDYWSSVYGVDPTLARALERRRLAETATEKRA